MVIFLFLFRPIIIHNPIKIVYISKFCVPLYLIIKFIPFSPENPTDGSDEKCNGWDHLESPRRDDNTKRGAERVIRFARRMRARATVIRLYFATQHNLPRRAAARANKRIITFLCITLKCKTTGKLVHLSSFPNTRNAQFPLFRARARHVAYLSGRTMARDFRC